MTQVNNILLHPKRWLLISMMFSTLAVLLFPGHSGEVFASQIEILTPRPGSRILARNPLNHLVLRQPQGQKPVRVKVENSGTTLDPFLVISLNGQSYFHFRLPLESGDNGFTLIPGGNRIELEFKKIQAEVTKDDLSGKNVYLFHQDPDLPQSCSQCHELRETEQIKLVGLDKQTACVRCHPNIPETGSRQHSPTANQQCLTCHQQPDDPRKIGFPKGAIKDLCFACHTGKKELFDQEFVHGPLILGGCTLCHDPHGQDNRYQLWAEGAVTLCIACHGDKQNLVRKKDRMPNVHGIIFGPGCVACHDPHATNQQFMLYEPTNTLCVGCHPDLANVTVGHPVTGHPVSAPSENLRPNRKLTCASCHQPHGSAHQTLLIESLQGGRLCRVCHQR